MKTLNFDGLKPLSDEELQISGGYLILVVAGVYLTLCGLAAAAGAGVAFVENKLEGK
jgi:hypothetical protein